MSKKTRTIIMPGSARCGKTLYLKKLAEYHRNQGKKVIVIGGDDKNLRE